MRVRVGMVASFLAVLFLVMSELSRLTGDVLDTKGRSWSANSLMGLGIPPMDGWAATFEGALTDARTVWMWAFLAIDVVFIATYVWAARTASLTSWPTLGSVVLVMGCFDITENVLALVATSVLSPAPSWLALALVFATLLKWGTFAVGIVVVVARLRSEAGYRRRVGRWAKGAYRHRFSLLAILPIAVIGVMPGSDLLDQLPDVQRRWLYDGAGHAWAATGAVLLVAAGLLLLGRLRSTTTWNASPGPVPDGQRANLWLALIVPGCVGVCLLIMWLRGSAGFLDVPGLLWWPFGLFIGIPVVISILSAVLRSRLDSSAAALGGWFPRPEFRIHDLGTKVIIVRAGDTIATLALVVAALGLIRSFTVVVALQVLETEVTLGLAVIGLLVGAAGAVLAWPAMRRLTDFVTRFAESSPQTWWQHRIEKLRVVMSPALGLEPNLPVRLLVLSAGIVLLLGIGLWPEWFAGTMGVIATAMLALLAACLVIGGTVVVLEQRLSPEVFWFKPINSPAVPVATIMIAAIALASTLGDNSDIHGVQGVIKPPTAGRPAVSLPERPDLPTAMSDWALATAACGETRSVAGKRVILRPMVLIAAEGGGIRAAYWSAAAIDLLSGSAAVQGEGIDWTKGSPSACARPLLAGGASGGAVGLTVARFASGDVSARDRVVTMSAPDALGQATDGLFVRDLVYSATGLPIFGRPAYQVTAATQPVWRDRGALMESVWAQTSGLSVPFLPSEPTDASRSRTGALVLNSTRVSDGCRMWVSQIDLGSDQSARCDAGSAPAGHTLDLFENLRPTSPGNSDDLCLGPITAATGAMLAARFPFVTPSGVAGPCGGSPGEQFVDGGYVENSGIKTIVDLAPAWLVDVQRRNSQTIQELRDCVVPRPDRVEACTNAAPQLIVPLVVYLDNGTGTDLRVDPAAKTPELLVPQRTTGRAKSALVDTPALLRESERLVSSESILPGADAELRTVVDEWRAYSVFVVYQSTVPAVTAPLGWVLSQQSIETMDQALHEQATTRRALKVPESPVLSGRGTLADALALLGRAS